MEKQNRWKLRFENFESALNSLLEIRNQEISENDILVDAGIQRFEVAFELAWKTIQDFLTEAGFSNLGGPKGVIKQALLSKLIDNGDAWLEMLKDRNSLSHEYIYTESRKIFKRIIDKHVDYLILLSNKLKNE